MDYNNKKKKLIETCKTLDKLEYLEIFNIIRQNNCQYSENKNGIFINLSNIQEEILDKIFVMLSFIKLKKEDLNKYEEFINNTHKKIDENNEIDEINEHDEIYEMDENNLILSSDEDNDLENKISLKKKKNKYSGSNAKIIKSIKNKKN